MERTPAKAVEFIENVKNSVQNVPEKYFSLLFLRFSRKKHLKN